jgi:hypothetical protein
MRPALDSVAHRVPRTKPTFLLHTLWPHRQWPFALVLHLHQHQSSRNLHLQYLAKNQSTQRCQSLITPGSDHPPVLEPHMVLINSPRHPNIRWLTATKKVASDEPMLCFFEASVHPVPSTSLSCWRSADTTAPTHYTDGASVHPVLKTPHPKRLW